MKFIVLNDLCNSTRNAHKCVPVAVVDRLAVVDYMVVAVVPITKFNLMSMKR